jgi:WD40 repeat protein
MDIARLKKDFDQIDRTLVTASNNFIVYGMSKNGGVRIIRQDDGKDARLFTETHDRIFSVVTSCSSADLKESIIGTGISGTVYWALIKDGEGDHIEESNPEMHGFALPPIQAQDSESPGGVLKTRARKSSAHPDFFAVGRGKFIHVIWPSLILKQHYLKNGKDRIVDVDKYLIKHSLKINTGKAGKDFTFSEDDTTIVSLDKAGRVKFWDVRSLTKTDIIGNPSHSQNIEIKEPLITFTTTPVTEKSWPTSVLFVDKLRPYQRGGALRYLIVGMKQNHTLQLWDLALGKPVQEIHLPHSKESDAVCSVLYHAATGMIIVGHPTRNSIYFLHLSAPKYNLQKNVTQAEFIEKLVANDSSVPKPDCTAVISGMREYSFANKGILRSLDILQTPNSAAGGGDLPTLFELYAMHSKGVTCLNIKQADLGWTSDNKVIDAVVADKAGVISIDTLKEIPAAPAPEVVEPAAQPSVPTRIVPRPAAKEPVAKETPKKAALGESSTSVLKSDEKVEKKEFSPSNGGLASASGPEKSEKKKKRKATVENAAAGPSSAPQPSQSSKIVVLDPSSNSRNGSLGKPNANATSETNSALPQDISDATLKNIETRVAAEVKKIFGASLDNLYQNIKDDRRTQAAVAEAKSDAMLRLVSSTLSDNVEVTLDRIVSSSIQKSVLPALSDIVDEQFGPKLNSHLIQNMPMELQKVLPDAIGRALQQPQLLKLMSESLAKSVAFRVEEQFAVILQNVVTPAFTSLAIQTSQRVAADVQRQAAAQIDAIERQRHADNIKIDQLTQLVTSLSETVSSMAAAQSDFQGQFLRIQQQAVIDRRQVSARQGEVHPPRNSVSRPSTALAAPVEKTPAELEYETMFNSISKAMAEGEYENAVIQWLQTQREQEFFKKYFCQFNPDFIRDLSPLLLLSLGATVSIDFEDDLIHQRIAWMETIVTAFQGHYAAGTLVRTHSSKKTEMLTRKTGATSPRPHSEDHGNLHSTYRAPLHADQPNLSS